MRSFFFFLVRRRFHFFVVVFFVVVVFFAVLGKHKKWRGGDEGSPPPFVACCAYFFNYEIKQQSSGDFADFDALFGFRLRAGREYRRAVGVQNTTRDKSEVQFVNPGKAVLTSQPRAVQKARGFR